MREDSPECNYTGICEARNSPSGISLCVHCGGEMRKVGESWYHHSQFNDNDSLISPENPQFVLNNP